MIQSWGLHWFSIFFIYVFCFATHRHSKQIGVMEWKKVVVFACVKGELMKKLCTLCEFRDSPILINFILLPYQITTRPHAWEYKFKKFSDLNIIPSQRDGTQFHIPCITWGHKKKKHLDKLHNYTTSDFSYTFFLQ